MSRQTVLRSHLLQFVGINFAVEAVNYFQFVTVYLKILGAFFLWIEPVKLDDIILNLAPAIGGHALGILEG
jgi:hypothetical protein